MSHKLLHNAPAKLYFIIFFWGIMTKCIKVLIITLILIVASSHLAGFI